ncbi:hypothetical protein RSOCI_03820 [Rhabdochlamydiaceae symbiont of Dictyostelium giganteum]
MEIFTKILTTSGLIKVHLPPIDLPSHKVRVYSFKDQSSEILKKVQGALYQESKKGRIFRGDLGKIDQDILTKPYLLKNTNSLTLISEEVVVALKQRTCTVFELLQTELQGGDLNNKEVNDFVCEGIQQYKKYSNLSQRFKNIDPLKCFTGRTEELSLLKRFFFKDTLESSSLSQKIIITGLRGCGKSTLALQYANTYTDQYNIIYWVDAKEKEIIEEHLDGLAKEWGILGSDKRERLKQLHLKLKNYPFNVLFIMDGIEQEDIFKAAMQYFPESDHISFLVTTALPYLQNYPSLQIKAFSLEESLLYLQQILNFSSTQIEKEKTVLQELANELENIPLALDLAAQAISNDHPNNSIATLLENLKQIKTQLYSQKNLKSSLKNYDALRILLWKQSINHLGKKYPQTFTQTLLEWISVLRGEVITEDLLQKLFCRSNSENDISKFQNSWNYLTEYSLLTKDASSSTTSNYYKVDSLLKNYIYDELSIQRQKELCFFIKDELVEQLSNLASHEKYDKEKIAIYRNHYAELLEIGSFELLLNYTEKTQTYYRLGVFFYMEKLYFKALPCFIKALEFEALAEKKTSIDVRQILNYLGNTYRLLKNYDDALQCYKKALEMAQELKLTTEVMKFYGLLGMMYNALKNHDESLKNYGEALKAAKELKNSLEEGKIYNSLGDIHFSLDHHSKAIELYKKCLEVTQENEKFLGVLSVFYQLGNSYSLLKEYNQAIEYHEKILLAAQSRKDVTEEEKAYISLGDDYHHLGNDHLAIDYYNKGLKTALGRKDFIKKGIIYRKLGNAYYSLRDYNQSVNYYEKELAIVIQLEDRVGEEKAYISLGNAYDSLGAYEEALKCYQKHIAIASESNNNIEKMQTYNNLGKIYNSLRNRLEALDCYKQALQIAQNLKDNKEECRIFGNLGNIYRSLGNYQSALESHQTALEIVHKFNDNKEEIRAYNNLGNTYYYLGEYSKAIECYKKALKLAQKLNSCKEEGRIYGNLGNVYRSLGDGLKAIDYHEKALKIAQELKDDLAEERAYENLGRTYNFLQEHSKAAECYEKALEITQKLNDRRGEGTAHGNLGVVYHSLGDIHKAIEHYNKRLTIALGFKDRVEEGKAYCNLGNAYTDLGEARKAIDYHEKDLKIALELQDKIGEGRAYCNLGNAYDFLGESYKAIKYQQKDLEIALELKNCIGEGRAYSNLGTAYASLGQCLKAIDYYKKALEITLNLNDHIGEGRIYGNLGNAYESLGKYSEAIDYHEKALECALKFKDSVAEGKAYGNLGNIYGSLSKHSKAIEYYKKSLIIAQKLNNLLDEGIAYGNLGNIYGSLGTYDLAEEYLRKGIKIGAILQKNIKEFQWQITAFEEQSKQYLSLELLLLMQNKDKEALEISDARRSRALISLISQKKPLEKNEDLPLEPLNVQQIQELAKKLHTIFIVYSLVDINQLIQVWIISPTYSSPVAVTLSAVKDEFQNLDEIFKSFPYEVHTKRPLKGEKQPHQLFKEKLADWYQLFIAPLTNYLPSLNSEETLTIIPDGFLTHLPFGAFYNEKEDQYLIEKYPISIVPSIRVLSLLEKRPYPSSNSALLVGKNRKVNLSYTEEDEVYNAIAPLLKIPQEDVLIQGKATVRNILEKAPDAKWIHIACHGVAHQKPLNDPYSVFEGAFKLADDEEYPMGELHAKDVALLNLKTDLVFMSASQMGRGNLKQEGSIGPIWSFLGAGARSIIASYWALPEGEMTIKMVKTFYEHYLGEGAPKLNKARALQKAVLMAMQAERNNPRQWGAFFLSGLPN